VTCDADASGRRSPAALDGAGHTRTWFDRRVCRREREREYLKERRREEEKKRRREEEKKRRREEEKKRRREEEKKRRREEEKKRRRVHEYGLPENPSQLLLGRWYSTQKESEQCCN
jgi:hypothetical protein